MGASTADGGRVVVAPGQPSLDGRSYQLDEFFREMKLGRRLSSRAAPFAWGFGGFLIGAMFWHLIGFWGFLSNVVLKSAETVPQSVAARQVAMPVALPNCTVLALNRSTGQTYSVTCDEDAPLLEEARSGRQDLASFTGETDTGHLSSQEN